MDDHNERTPVDETGVQNQTTLESADIGSPDNSTVSPVVEWSDITSRDNGNGAAAEDDGVWTAEKAIARAETKSSRYIAQEFIDRGAALRKGKGVQKEVKEILEKAAEICDAIEMGLVLDAIAGTKVANKGDMKKHLAELKHRKKAESQHKPTGGHLADEWVFVGGASKFYNVNKMVGHSMAAFNQRETGTEVAGGENLPASETFKQQGGRSVDALFWLPSPPGAQFSPIFSYDNKLMLNTFRPLEPIPPGATPDRLAPWVDLMRHVVPDERERMAFIQHMAATVQFPDKKIDWQVLMIGTPGIGKDSLLVPMMKYFGSAASEISKESHDTGWGDMRAGKKILLFGEVWRPRDRQFANSIKALAASTSSGTDKLNMKGGAVVEQFNLYSIYCFSNHADALHLERDERRWFVIDAFDVPVLPQDFYTEYYRWLDHDNGWKYVISYLLSVDIQNFSWGRLPFKTRGFKNMQTANHSDLSGLLTRMIEEKQPPFGSDLVTFEAIRKHRDIVAMFEAGKKSGFTDATLSTELFNLGIRPLPEPRHRGTRSARVNGRKITHHTPKLWAGENRSQYLTMSGAELYDACPVELFSYQEKKFDAAGNYLEVPIKPVLPPPTEPLL